MLNYKGNIFRPYVTAMGPSMVINYVYMSTCENAADISSDDKSANFIQSNVSVSHVKIMKPNNVSPVSYNDSALGNIQSIKRNQVDAETLAKH